MKTNNDVFLAHLEWETIEDGHTITNTIFENQVYNLDKNCIINFSRDQQYKLEVKISGVIADANDLRPKTDQKNQRFIPKETIHATSNDGFFIYKFHGIAIDGIKSSGISNSLVGFTSALIVDSIEKVLINSEDKITKLQEWYLSGNVQMLFPESTRRVLTKTYKRQRDIDLKDDVTREGSSFSWDYMLIKQADFSFVISKVPKEFGPEWSFNLCIEYSASLGRIPDADERRAITELISFVFGTQLLKIGTSHYDHRDHLLKQEYQNPWGSGIIAKCQKIGTPPVNIRRNNNREKASQLITQFLPVYLSKRKELRLKDVLWKYWMGKSSNIGTNLPILSSAIETLTHEILKNHPEIKDHYIEYKVFSTLIQDELTSIDEKLEVLLSSELIEETKEIREKIIKKIKDSAGKSATQKIETMFKIIELPIGSLERKALNARHKMAHSSMGDDEEEIKKIIHLSAAYETLIHRVLLKILNYTGDYIDYYSKNYPNRHIDEVISKGQI